MHSSVTALVLPLLHQASDMVSTSRILVAVVQMCYQAKDWDALNENIMLLTKRRSQLKQVGCKIYFKILLKYCFKKSFFSSHFNDMKERNDVK